MSFKDPATGKFARATKTQCVVKSLSPEQIKANQELLASIPSAQDVKDLRQKRQHKEVLARRFRQHEKRVGAPPRGLKPDKRHPQSFQVKPKPKSTVEDASPETYESKYEDKGFNNNAFAVLAELG